MPITDKSSLPTILIIFGATGDLATRKLIPALFHLHQQKLLPPLWNVVGFSRRNLSSEQWREHIAKICRKIAPGKKKVIAEFAQSFIYQPGDFTEGGGYTQLGKILGQQDRQWRTCANKLFYLAVPPTYYKTILQNLADSGLTIPCSPEEGWTRVIIEKPFGKDLATAQELDRLLGQLFQEEQIYRIDHYLGKETVQNILAFRFSNSLLEPAWNKDAIDTISIQLWEEGGLQTRGDFYDGVGALRDVGQNHLLQLLALFAMENPGQFDAASIRARRAEVLEALDIMNLHDVAGATARGQYKGYRRSSGVDPRSVTETYFRVKTHLQLPRWYGVPIFLESGKKLAEAKVEVDVTFKHQTPCLCPPNQHARNVLRYRIQPKEGIVASFWVKKPGREMVIEEKDFSFDYKGAYRGEEFVEAYTKLLLDAIAGDQTLFVSTSEIMASWRFIDPIEQAWRENRVPLQLYKAGSLPDFAETSRGAGTKPVREIGYIGLGKMGLNMVTRLKRNGWRVVAFDPQESAREQARALGAEIVTEASDVVKKLKGPRLLWIMVPHQAVDTVLKQLQPHLQAKDTVIDGGNSFYKDSIRWGEELAKKKVHFLDVGVSGGPEGARMGACLMIGGSHEQYTEHLDLWQDVATVNGYGYMGKLGAGHFVKMIHNGIEYGMMQAIAEGFAVLKDSQFELDLEKVADLFNHGSVIESRLIGWLKEAYAQHDEELKSISGSVAQSGEGQWTVQAAKELGIPVPIIEGALQFRVQSQDEPSYTGKVLSTLRNQFGGHDVRAKI